MITTEKDLMVFDETCLEANLHGYDLEEWLDPDEVIVGCQLVSRELGYLLTNKRCLILLEYNLESPILTVLRRFPNAVKFDAIDNTLALVFSDPHTFAVFQHDNDKPCFIKTRGDLAEFAMKSIIAVINQQDILIYNESRTKLLNARTGEVVDIPVGGEKMHYEHPYLLALNGTTFTKYDMNGIPLQYYKFEGAFRVIPDRRWSSFALHHAQVLTKDAHMQFVSRRADQEVVMACEVLMTILPGVLVELIQSYIESCVPDIPKSISKVFATLTSVQARQPSDLSEWKPRMTATDGVYTIHRTGALIMVSGGKVKIPKKIDSNAHHDILDFDFVTEGIAVFIKPPDDKIWITHFRDDIKSEYFDLGITTLEHACFYRDEKGLLHLMVLTRTLTYDYIIGHQESGQIKNVIISKQSMTSIITKTIIHSLIQLRKTFSTS